MQPHLGGSSAWPMPRTCGLSGAGEHEYIIERRFIAWDQHEK